MLAADYPFVDVLWTMFVFFAWVIWFWMLIAVFGDLFRRRDIGGGTKVLWFVLVIVLPYLGVFVYLISQGRQMGERNAEQANAQRRDFDTYVKSVAADGGGGAASEIEKAKQLLDSGAISQEEYDRLKQRALA